MSGDIGDTIEAGGAQGVINKPEGPVNLNYGDTNSAGQDLAGRDVNKNTIFNIIVSPTGTEAGTTAQLLQQLEGLINAADSSQITQAFRDSLPPDSRVSRQGTTDLGSAIQQLQDFRSLEKFAKKLEGLLSSQSLENLQAYLMLALRPDRAKPDQFRLKAWLIPDSKSPGNCISLIVESLDKENEAQLQDANSYLIKDLQAELPNLLNSFLKSSEQFLREPYDLSIELFLPILHIWSEIDRYAIKLRSRQIPIGAKYPITVRSSERLDDPDYRTTDYRNDWLKNWNKVKNLLNDIPEERIFYPIDQLDSCNWNSFITEFVGTEQVGIKVNCPISEDDSEDLFLALLDAAVPIAIWSRQSIPESDLLQEIAGLLTSGPLFKLPKLLWKQRSSASDPDKHLACHLALLWEDPSRLPPDVQPIASYH
ncbi:hypothetical protein NDI52_11730 [Leptolyngbya sp. PL-A3]|uniref:VMAP-C domain-containing protein n=1 Tax=Leptolyngbya sp. PL-A3 TaxID=2933911 RepID=UPI003297455C